MPLAAQSATLTGMDPSYSGAAIRISIPGNPFIEAPLFNLSVRCDQRGSFRAEVPLETGTMVELETGIYEGILYLEPGDTYRVTLPPFREKTTSNQISPFFQPRRVPLKTAGEGSQVNLGIYRFDSLFSAINEEVIFARRLGTDINVDSIIRDLETRFGPDTSRFFRDYRKYKYGVLKLNQGRTPPETISRHYLGPDVQEDHPGFMELFRAVFKDFLIYLSRTPEGAGIRNHINRVHHPDSIRQIISAQPSVWNDTLTDMVLLNSLSDLFYRGNYHKEAILNLLDSLAADPVNPAFREYSLQMRDKLSSLVIGHLPPPLSLENTKGDTVSLSQLGGKYIYLMFCTPDNYGCMIEYPFLQSYHLKHSEYLEVVTVMVARSAEVVRKFMERNGYRWNALFLESHTGLLDRYMVKALPTAYLIGPDGRLVLSPASLPSEGFEQQLFRIMRSRGEI